MDQTGITVKRLHILLLSLAGMSMLGSALVLTVVWFPVRMFADIGSSILAMMVQFGTDMIGRATGIMHEMITATPVPIEPTHTVKICAAEGCQQLTLGTFCEIHQADRL